MRAKVKIGGWTWKGTTYKKGDPVDAPAAQITAWTQRGLVAVLETGAEVSSGVERAVAEPVAEKATAEPDGPEKWTLTMGPEEYLERFPDGPNADLARAHVEG